MPQRFRWRSITPIVQQDGLPQRNGVSTMVGVPRRYSHFIFAVIQAGLTCLIAAGIASLPLVTLSQFLIHWLLSWLVSWLTMLPVVVLAAPMIQSASFRLTSGE